MNIKARSAPYIFILQRKNKSIFIISIYQYKYIPIYDK